MKTFLEKFEFFCKDNGYVKKNGTINIAEFSEKSEIPYTTIDGWYKNGINNIKLSTLKKLAKFTNTTLDFWGSDNIEDEIINIYTDPESGLTVALNPTDKPWEEYTKEEQEQYIAQAMDTLYEYKRSIKGDEKQ